MIDKIKQMNQEKQIIEYGDKIVVAVSGGPDSIALLHILYSLREEYNLTLYVCHLNHMLRGEAAEGDAKYVKTYAESLGLEVFIFSKDIEAFSKQLKMGFEEAAREARYRLFDYVLRQTGAQKIAVGQNKNDQAETLLMRLFRGAGLEGLTAIKFKRDHVIRPMLHIERTEIESYIKKHNLKTRTDHTNFETDYARNKIRLEMIPYIKKHFNEGIVSKLYDTSQLLNDDLDLIQTEVQKTFQSYVQTGNRLSIDLEIFNNLHKSIQSRLVRKMIKYYRGHLRDISYAFMQEILQVLHDKKHGACIVIEDTLKIEISYGLILIYPVIEKEGLELTKYLLGESFSYKNYTFKSLPLPLSSRTEESITVDYTKIKGSLFLRTRLPGDRFMPLGMKGSKKLKDYFIDHKIPVVERDDVLLLCDEENIIWVVGYRMSELYKIDSKTVDRLTFIYEKNAE